MKFLIFSFNEVDKVYSFYGLKDTYEEAIQHASKVDWPDKPTNLNFIERDADKYFVFGGVFSAQSGHDGYFIVPVEDRS